MEGVREGGTRMGEKSGKGIVHDQVLVVRGKRTRRKNRNRHFQQMGVGGTLWKVPETWEVRDSQDSKGGTLDEMTSSAERKFVEPTSNRKTGHQV